MAPVADRTRFRLKFTKKYAPLEHFGSGLVYHADMATAMLLPFSVLFWGSHPDEGNDDCHSGDDFATIEEARGAFDDWQSTAGSDAAYTTHVQLDGPDVHEIKQVVSDEELTRRKRAREQEAKRDAAEWQREIAMEAGMLGGCDAYNEAMAWD